MTGSSRTSARFRPLDAMVTRGSRWKRMSRTLERPGHGVDPRPSVDSQAWHAISTVYFDVVQKHHNTLFTPDLPSRHKSALMNSGIFMANLTHVLIQFPTVWWDDYLPAWLSAQVGGQQSVGNFTLSSEKASSF